MSTEYAGDGAPTLILGIGTGRCGSHTLAEVLDRQPGAHVTHEERPLLAWRPTPGRPGIRERLQRFRRTRTGRLIGDVASSYLPHVEEAIAVEPGIRVICLERPREEVVASFCRWLDTVHALPTDHWSREPAAGWHHHPIWTRVFPQYDMRDREEGIRRYWDEYHRAVADLARRFPANLRVYPTEVLNEEPGLRALLSFAGIPEDRQVVRIGTRAGRAEQVRPHARRAVTSATEPDDPRRCVILVPEATPVVPAREAVLRGLERRGYVVRRFGVDDSLGRWRSEAATAALIDGFEETLWIDADLGFDPEAVDRLRSHGAPIVCGIRPPGDRRGLAGHVPPGATGPSSGAAGGLLEVRHAAADFLLVRRRVYMDMQRRLDLPVCDEHVGRPLIPFFQPLVCPHGGGHRYLAADDAFCEQARRCGYRVLVDAAIRLRQVGRDACGGEDVGIERERSDASPSGPA